MRIQPLDVIQKRLSEQLPENLLPVIPQKWEKIGDVVTIKLPVELKQYQAVIGKAYAEILGCKTTLNEVGGISGEYRNPTVEVIYGSSETETIHVENGVRFKLDPQKIMFSSGNIEERRRMATISNPQETVVDLFAGIGYFTIPMAVFSKPKKVFACEINPLAYQYLCKNIVLNQVTDIVQPLLGDNRTIAPKDCAQRVILGYFKDTAQFLQIAVECLKDKRGILHFHDVYPITVVPEKPLQQIEVIAKKYKRSIRLLGWKQVKTYAPGIIHVVLDVEIGG